MHYVRFLRQPSITGKGKHRELSLVFIVTSDLGDSLMSADKPLRISASLFEEGGVGSGAAGFSRELMWKPGARVVKEKIPVPDAPWRLVMVRATSTRLSARQFETLAAVPQQSGQSPRNPLVVPAWFDFKTGNRPAGSTDVCLRKLDLPGPVSVEFEEEFGDSIARHVWDGGLAAVSFLAQVHDGRDEARRLMPTVARLLQRDGPRPLNVLELGCGVGVLGIGLAGLLSLATAPEVIPRCHFLMTDVPEAEERALANIRLFRASQEKKGRAIPTIQYENLDWEQGRRGRFSESVRSKQWDLVILSDCTYNTDTIPALVETLSQLNSLVTGHGGVRQRPLQVFLATKPRHSSEQAAFDILGSRGWTVREKAVVELHGLPEETEDVEFYFLETK
ncbi:hypothetical protein VUR80DRAFT_9181 [Thermomyces stellatus]